MFSLWTYHFFIFSYYQLSDRLPRFFHAMWDYFCHVLPWEVCAARMKGFLVRPARWESLPLCVYGWLGTRKGVVSSLTQVRSTWRTRKVSFVHFNYCIGLRVEAIAEFLFVLSLLRMNVDTPICAELYNAWECIFLINMNYLF